MAEITTKNIRNVVLLGHGGSGKTSIAEAALYLTKGTDRLGKTTAGNTVCDYDPEEIKRGFSLTLSLAPVMWETSKINFIDTPGFFDFSGEVDAAVRVADSAVITLDGKAGVEVGAEIAWDKAQEAKIPCAFFVNKCDDPDADFEKVFNELHEKFGAAVCPLLVPVKNGKDVKFLNLISREAYTFDANGKRTNAPFNSDDEDVAAGYTDTLNEALAQTSEELLDKFFETAEITQEEAVEALHQGIIDGSIVPVFSGCATNLWGITFLLDTIHDSFPRPTAKKVEQIIDGDSFKDKPIVTDGECSLFVFKTIADTFVGKMTFFKVMSGTLTNDLTMKNVTSGTTEKMAHIYTMRGKKQTEVTSLCCGDIGMIAKLAGTNTNDTLTVSSDFEYRKIAFPHPYYTMAITPAAKGDEDKISTGIARLLEEDKTLAYENNAETKQMTISGLGDMQLDVLVARMKSRYGTTVLLETPKIAYRETVELQKQYYVTNQMYSDLWMKIVSNATVNSYPEAEVTRVYNEKKTQYESYAKYYGTDYETFLKNYVGITDDDLMEESRDYVKEDLVMYTLADELGITISDEEYAEGLDFYAGYYGFSTDELLNYYGKNTIYATILWQKMMETVAPMNNISQN